MLFLCISSFISCNPERLAEVGIGLVGMWLDAFVHIARMSLTASSRFKEEVHPDGLERGGGASQPSAGACVPPSRRQPGEQGVALWF